MNIRKKICSVILFIIVLLFGTMILYSFHKIEDTPLMNGSYSENKKEKKMFYIENFGDFSNIIANREGIFIVFGKDSCHFCDLYKPVLEKFSQDYQVEIGYVNMTALGDEDYQLVMDSGLKIPAKCSKNGNTIEIKEGFGTPLGLFVRNGEVYDCIRGYNDYETLEILIKRIGYIE